TYFSKKILIFSTFPFFFVLFASLLISCFALYYTNKTPLPSFFLFISKVIMWTFISFVDEIKSSHLSTHIHNTHVHTPTYTHHIHTHIRTHMHTYTYTHIYICVLYTFERLLGCCLHNFINFTVMPISKEDKIR
ncbi:hypothetical protein LOAG_10044, partial [Loa loa]